MPQSIQLPFRLIVGEGDRGSLQATLLVSSPFQNETESGASFVLIPLAGEQLTDLMTRIAEAQSQDEAQKAHPASKKMISGLPVHQISSDYLPQQHCTVCLEDWEHNQLALEMPCRHLYHKDCLLPWLERANTCPSCRYPLFTEDEEYNKKVEIDISSRFSQHDFACVMKPVGLCEAESHETAVSLSCGHFFHDCCFRTSLRSTGQEINQVVSPM
ncbi:hypothetical protein L0F63_002471 [Massospora cicadina]|nr:hypothetical protein L0F63_002471 [Massospora cicadina]